MAAKPTHGTRQKSRVVSSSRSCGTADTQSPGVKKMLPPASPDALQTKGPKGWFAACCGTKGKEDASPTTGYGAGVKATLLSRWSGRGYVEMECRSWGALSEMRHQCVDHALFRTPRWAGCSDGFGGGCRTCGRCSGATLGTAAGRMPRLGLFFFAGGDKHERQ